jgi:hypothetical protein
MTEPGKEPTRTLEEQLERIATADLIVDLESAYHQAARPGAEALLRRAATIDAKTIPSLDDPKEIAAVAAAMHLRAVDLLEFWEPLLVACKSGQSTAPLRDLRGTIKQARALEELVSGRKKTKARDAVLKKTTVAAESLEAWLPQRTVSSTVATKYSRGAFDEEDEDADAVPGIKPPPDSKPRKVKIERPESAARKVLGWLLTILVLAGMGYGAWYVLQQQTPPARDTAYFNALVFDVAHKATDPDAVVFTMTLEWLAKPRPEREADITTLRGHLDREATTAMKVVDRKGGVLATVDAAGAVTWVRETLNAEETLKVGDVAREPIQEVEAEPEPEPTEVGPEGVLEKPMTAEELRRSSSP